MRQYRQIVTATGYDVEIALYPTQGRNHSRTHRSLFGVSGVPAARARTCHAHVYVGHHRQGKSKLLEHVLLQDFLAGRGCGLLNPHTDLANDLLASLHRAGFFRNAKNRERVVYFDPAHTDSLLPFNVLHSTGPPYATAIHLIEAFRRICPESLREAPRFTNRHSTERCMGRSKSRIDPSYQFHQILNSHRKSPHLQTLTARL